VILPLIPGGNGAPSGVTCCSVLLAITGSVGNQRVTITVVHTSLVIWIIHRISFIHFLLAGTGTQRRGANPSGRRELRTRIDEIFLDTFYDSSSDES
jgi:hypothetical protein